ncbi:hypothetical protein [Methylocapsa aurea]|uniref:hypothetical protein n=1 Tax=Methylocapsa aurea TaxID=663610 RepID=UPI003CC948DA
MLDWPESAKLRRGCHAGLNKGESHRARAGRFSSKAGPDHRSHIQKARATEPPASIW